MWVAPASSPVLLPRVADFEGSCPRQEPRLEAGATHRLEAGATQERLRRQLCRHTRRPSPGSGGANDGSEVQQRE